MPQHLSGAADFVLNQGRIRTRHPCSIKIRDCSIDSLLCVVVLRIRHHLVQLLSPFAAYQRSEQTRSIADRLFDRVMHIAEVVHELSHDPCRIAENVQIQRALNWQIAIRLITP